jgi:hypothetical protein
MNSGMSGIDFSAFCHAGILGQLVLALIIATTVMLGMCINLNSFALRLEAWCNSWMALSCPSILLSKLNRRPA